MGNQQKITPAPGVGEVLHKTSSTWGRSTLVMDTGIASDGLKIMSQRRSDGICVHLYEGQDQIPAGSLGREDVPPAFVGPSYLEEVQMRPGQRVVF